MTSYLLPRPTHSKGESTVFHTLAMLGSSTQNWRPIHSSNIPEHIGRHKDVRASFTTWQPYTAPGGDKAVGTKARVHTEGTRVFTCPMRQQSPHRVVYSSVDCSHFSRVPTHHIHLLLVHTRPDWSSQAWTSLFTCSLTTASLKRLLQLRLETVHIILQPVPHDTSITNWSVSSCFRCLPVPESESTNYSVISECCQIFSLTSRSARTAGNFLP